MAPGESVCGTRSGTGGGRGPVEGLERPHPLPLGLCAAWRPDGGGERVQPHSCVFGTMGCQRDGGVCDYQRWQCREPLHARYRPGGGLELPLPRVGQDSGERPRPGPALQPTFPSRPPNLHSWFPAISGQGTVSRNRSDLNEGLSTDHLSKRDQDPHGPARSCPSGPS